LEKYCTIIMMSMKLGFSLLCLSSVKAFSPLKIHQRQSRDVSFCSDKSKRRADILLLAAKVGIFFGSSTGNTESVADMICGELGEDAEGPFDIDEIQGAVGEKFAAYDALIVGTPTWNTGADSERSGTGWDEIYYGEMQDLKIAGKKVAVFGLGDQVSYGENYADATGELHDVFEDLGCKMLGFTCQDGYEHEESKAIRGEQFCGLLCDEINQDDLTEERVTKWVAQLRSEGILETASTGKPMTAEVVQNVPVSKANNNDSEQIAELERENTRLRKMLEDSKMMDEVLKSELLEEGYVPHYNPKTLVTMWTSIDGKKCYYTKEAPRNP